MQTVGSDKVKTPGNVDFIRKNNWKKYIFLKKKWLTHPAEYNIMYNCDIG